MWFRVKLDSNYSFQVRPEPFPSRSDKSDWLLSLTSGKLLLLDCLQEFTLVWQMIPCFKATENLMGKAISFRVETTVTTWERTGSRSFVFRLTRQHQQFLLGMEPLLILSHISMYLWYINLSYMSSFMVPTTQHSANTYCPQPLLSLTLAT